MSYANDQFFYIKDAEPADVAKGRVNRPFEYPSSQVRFLRSNNGRYEYSNYNLQKGYIRQVNEYSYPEPGFAMSCHFQFNPSSIAQTASWATGLTHPLYLPASQLNQPMTSMTNFNFQLFFDRSYELNNPNSEDIPQATNIWETGGPSRIGVLHDLGALFKVIGQGISSDTLELLARSAEEQLAAQSLTSPLPEPIAEDDDLQYAAAISNSNAFLRDNVNIGNIAWIIPLPVRVVFSSLYIVEGFVTSTAVDIVKFNQAYVPMQATVSLSMSAMYIGFAKKETYFTRVLRQSAAEQRNQLERVREQNNIDRSILLSLGFMSFEVVNQTSGTPGPALTIGEVTPSFQNGVLALPKLATVVSEFGGISRSQSAAESGGGAPTIVSCFKGGFITSISSTRRFVVAGPASISPTASLPRSNATNMTDLLSDLKVSNRVLRDITFSTTANSAEDWVKFPGGLGGKNQIIGQLDGGQIGDRNPQSNSVYVIAAETSVTVQTTNGSYSVTSVAYSSGSLSSTSPASLTVRLPWALPDVSAPPEVGTSVPTNSDASSTTPGTAGNSGRRTLADGRPAGTV